MKDPMNLRDRSVLVLGLGTSGAAMARWCLDAGAHVRAADSRTTPPNLEALRADYPTLNVHLGACDPTLLAGVDLVCVSPGIAPRDAAFGSLLESARAQGIALLGELGLFVAALCALHTSQGYAPSVLAVTGTNGKTTVTALTTHLLKGAGVDAQEAGNIGPAMLDTLRARIDSARLPAAWVLELSSFQLHGADDFAATAATVLNITQDHLDWHGTMQAYVADKARIFGPGVWQLPAQPGLMVLNRDDTRVMALGRAGRRMQTFGLDTPQRDGDWGVVHEHGMAWLARARIEAEQEQPKRRSKGVPPPVPVPVSIQMLMPADALRIQGRHNWANALAALALAASTGAALGPMLHGLRAYRGEPHRMQPLGMIDGVEWIEDSKGTNVGATVAALQGMQRPVVLIAGGDGKGQDFTPLGEAASTRLRAALLIGRDAAAIEAVLGDICTVERMPDLEQATRRAAELARAGDVVLLSPACASLDMFRNYAHRAEVFTAAVTDIAHARGVQLEAGA